MQTQVWLMALYWMLLADLMYFLHSIKRVSVNISSRLERVERIRAARQHVWSASLNQCAVWVNGTLGPVNLSSIDELIRPFVPRASISKIHWEYAIHREEGTVQDKAVIHACISHVEEKRKLWCARVCMCEGWGLLHTLPWALLLSISMREAC